MSVWEILGKGAVIVLVVFGLAFVLTWQVLIIVEAWKAKKK